MQHWLPKLFLSKPKLGNCAICDCSCHGFTSPRLLSHGTWRSKISSGYLSIMYFQDAGKFSVESRVAGVSPFRLLWQQSCVSGAKRKLHFLFKFSPRPEMATVKNKLFCFPLLFLLLSALFQLEHTWSVHTLQVGQRVFQPLHGLHLVALEASQTKLLWEDRTGNGFTQGRLSGKQHRLVTASLWGYPNKPGIFHI